MANPFEIVQVGWPRTTGSDLVLGSCTPTPSSNPSLKRFLALIKSFQIGQTMLNPEMINQPVYGSPTNQKPMYWFLFVLLLVVLAMLVLGPILKLA